MTRVRRFCRIVALIVVLFIAYEFWISGPITVGRLWPVLPVAILAGSAALVIAAMFSGIFLKRIFVPKLDYEESKKRPRYTAL